MRTLRPHLDAIARCAAITLTLVLTLGCALHKARTSFDEGRYEEALEQYRQILKKNPDNVQAKIGYRRTAPLASEVHLKRAMDAKKAGREDIVRREVASALVLDPSNAVAENWMARLEEEAARARQQAEEEDSIDVARQKGEAKLALPINPRSLEGMDLNFTRKTSLREIFLQLSKNSGVNIILHSSASAQDTNVSVDLRGLTFQRILDTLMLQSDLFYKVLDTNTIMVFKKTPQNLQDYENRLIKTFYLSNAEVDNVRAIFNAIMPTIRVFPDKRLNAITIQAKQTDLATATRIVNQLDKAKAEVIVYLELLEVSDTAQERVGLLPTANLADPSSTGLYRIGAITSTVNGGMNSNVGGIKISKSQLNFLFAPLALDMLKNTGEGKLLASPNVRVVSGEQGEINIGEKISTTQSQLGGLGGINPGASTAGSAAAGALASIGGSLASSTQYAYEDVGVKIKVKPRVHFNDDITVELDSDVRSVKAGSAQGRPDLGTRSIKTFARLRNGETAVFGGLLKEDETKSLSGIWGLTDIPILGKLFGSNTKSKSRTDVILTMRVVIVRKPDLGQEDFEAFDPDQAASETKPFTPKPAKKPLPPGLQSEVPAAPKPAAPKAEAPKEPAPDAKVPDAPKPLPEGPKAAPDASRNAAAAPTDSSLVFFFSPLSTETAKGQRVTLNLFASGAQGLTSGSLSLQVDPRLKVVSVTPGDFLSAEGGTLNQTPGKDGMLTLSFSRPAGATDSGTFAVLELEAMEPGKATVLIQDGKYLVGPNPIPARYVNSLVTIQ